MKRIISGLAALIFSIASFSLFASTFSLSEKFSSDTVALPNEATNIKLSASTELRYNFNSDYYAIGKLIRRADGTLGYGATLGIQRALTLIQPYAEIKYCIDKNALGFYYQKAEYAAGIHIIAIPEAQPFFEINDFLQKGQEYYKTGISFLLPKGIYFELAYQKQIEIYGNGIELAFSYDF